MRVAYVDVAPHTFPWHGLCGIESAMRIATWNINGMKARLAYLLLWLRDAQPDIVGLQELKMTDDKFPRAAVEELGYHVATYGQKSWNGVAVLSREPLQVVQQGLPGQDEMGARLLTVTVGDVSFTTVYCPNGKYLEHADYKRKLAFFDALATHVQEHLDPHASTVLCGDFNIVPAAIDSWNEPGFHDAIFHTDDERARLKRLLDWGFVDLYRRCHPDEPGFSWWDYRGGAFPKRQGLRIDLVLGTSALADRMTEARVERRWRKKQQGLIASDHAPVWVDID